MPCTYTSLCKMYMYRFINMYVYIIYLYREVYAYTRHTAATLCKKGSSYRGGFRKYYRAITHAKMLSCRP